MARKRHSDEDILKLLREVELKLANGSDVQSVCRSVGVIDATYYNWRKRFGRMGKSQLSELCAPKDDYALRLALVRLAKQFGRYGYRKIAELLRTEGWKVNHKKVERIWHEEGLQLPQRHKKRRRLYHKDSLIIRLRPTHPNHVWAIDFVHDKLENGRSYKMLTVLDEYTRQALAVTVRTGMRADDVLEALYPLLLHHGTPEYIRSDNCPEFIA